jgi:hypothetical protein
MTALNDWENFYVIIGSSAGALIGLQFVVLTLMADLPRLQGDMELATNAFTTPSVVHFQMVLLLSALICAPWSGFDIVAIIWGMMGLFGIGYSIVVIWRFRRVDVYHPVFEDWFYYVLLPMAGYTTLFLSALAAHFHERPALFGVAAAALLLLFNGIHNAWDLVIHMIFARRRRLEEEEASANQEKPK